MRSYRYFDIVTVAFVAVLLTSNIASSAKIVDGWVTLGGLRLSFDGGTLLFPLSYIFADILTEVYGFARSRRVIWMGFFSMLLMSAFLAMIGVLPGEVDWLTRVGNASYSSILGGVYTGGILIASLTAYIVGEFCNAVVLAKMKVRTQGRFLWMRTIGSTIVGEGIDTVLFTMIACLFAVFPWNIALSLIVTNYIFKVAVEIIATPLTYKIIAFLKRAENEDYFDRTTRFSPFAMS